MTAGVVCGLMLVSPGAARASWSAPEPIDSSAAASLGYVSSVSCASASFCAAVDQAGNAITYQQHTWSKPRATGASVLNSVSCPTNSYCVAVGGGGSDENAGGVVTTFRGGSWSPPVMVDPVNPLDSVSCASTTFCVAVDDVGDAVTFFGGGWGAPVSVDPGGNSLVSVSCPSSSFCAAVTNQSDTSSFDLFTYRNGLWNRVGTDNTSAPSAVSCTSASFCVAVDELGDALTYNGSSWSAPRPSSDGFGGTDSVSCPSRSFCVAAVDLGSVFFYGTSLASLSPVQLASSTATLSRRGRLTLEVGCSEAVCQGTIAVVFGDTVQVASTHYRVRRGRPRPVVLTLGRSAFQLLKTGESLHELKLQVTIDAVGSPPLAGTVTFHRR